MTKGKGSNPGAGGLNKHIKSVVHKERAQPAKRRQLGPLEKRKDYVKRAEKRKQRVKRVQQIKRAAAQRNPDEFNVKMTQYSTDTGTGKIRKEEKRNTEASLAAAIKAGQVDAKYLERKASDDLHRARDLTAVVGGLDAAPQGRHTVFVDSHRDVASFRAERHFDTTKAMLASPAQRGRIAHMGTIRVGHALDHTDDASLLRRFQRGEFDWDEELLFVREAQQIIATEKRRREQQEQENINIVKKRTKKETPLQDSRSLRESLFQKEEDADDDILDDDETRERKKKLATAANTAPAVLLRMLRRAAVLEAQHNEQEMQARAARSAREVVERARRADKLQKLAAVVKKKTHGQFNQLNERKMMKFRPGYTPRTK